MVERAPDGYEHTSGLAKRLGVSASRLMNIVKILAIEPRLMRAGNSTPSDHFSPEDSNKIEQYLVSLAPPDGYMRLGEVTTLFKIGKDRAGQVARELNITPGEYNGANGRKGSYLSPDQITRIKDHLATSRRPAAE